MKRFLTLLLLCSLLTLAGCGGRQVGVPENEPEAPAPSVEAPAPAEAVEAEPEPVAVDPAAREAAEREARVRSILDGMTLEQKVGQLFFARCVFNGMESKIAQYHLGGVLLFTQDYKDAADNWLSRDDFAAKIEGYQKAAGNIPLFIGSDEEGGTVTRASRNPNLFDRKLPSPQALYRAGGMEGLLQAAAAYNAALRELGVNVNFAPVADVSTNPGDFIYERSFGQDAAATAEYVGRVVSQMAGSGMCSVLKHFPGYGDNVDTHTGIAVDERPYETFEKADFLPFRTGIAAGAPFVLVSHNIVSCMDAALPASLSPAVHEILRGELGFEGVILTDDLAMGAVKAYADGGSAAVLALKAGNDMIVTTDFSAQIEQVLAAVEDGTIPMETIDAAVTRVLNAKMAFGVLEDGR